MPYNIRLRCVLILSLAAMSVAGPIWPAQAKPLLKSAIKRQHDRNRYIKFEALIDALGITPGMTILDIGAGPGYASFLFAGRLHGSGEVYATDIRKDFVDNMADEARKRGLTNLFPVVVKEKGLDDFYGRHRYDLVFLSNVYHCLDDRVTYFTRLRGLLKPNARLVVVIYNQVPLFSPDDFSDFDGLAASLSGSPGDDPFVRHLSAATRRLLEDRTSREDLVTSLVDDFNRMLVDPRFYEGFYDNSYLRRDFLGPSEREFANWLLMTLREDGVLDRPVDRVDPKALRAVIRLNRLFFAGRFGTYLANGGQGTYVPAGDANRQTSKYAMLRELDAAGYRLVEETRLSSYFDAVIMTPKAP
jgi:SAM-dependent methyltransferase